MKLRLFILVNYLSLTFIRLGECVCYFPIEYQGVYLSQTQAGLGPNGQDPVKYQSINIEVGQIFPWGQCHEMFGNNVILWDSFHGSNCMRCFHLSRKSPNVIQIYTEGLARCYTNLAAAKATCPGEDRPLSLRAAQEITVYRTAGPSGSSIEPVYCAINGKFKFTYSANNGQFSCPRSVSELSNCPFGMGLNVKFTECSFEDLELNFQCLGDWNGLNGKRYMALLDTRVKTHPHPKYRCAIYEKDEVTGEIKLSLSEDSTCTNNLMSATQGFELLTLKPVPSMSWPTRVQSSSCYFPSWLQGDWENMKVQSNEITFEDHTLYKTSRMRCISDNSNSTHGVFHVYSITHCGEESELCLMIKKRSPNVVELMFGQRAITEEMLQQSVHADMRQCWGQFEGSSWITQGKKRSFAPTPCPIEGDYTGVVPGAPGLCAKVSSDCNNPEIMFYTVSACSNRSQLFEEREYQCLGQWEENGILFTYTQRRDIDGYFCFSGIVKNKREAFIKEAGNNCQRGENPRVYGMKLLRQAVCNSHRFNPYPTRRTEWNPRPTPFKPWDLYPPTNRPEVWRPPSNELNPSNLGGQRPTKNPSANTKPWFLITAVPTQDTGGSSGHTHFASILVTAIALSFVIVN